MTLLAVKVKLLNHRDAERPSTMIFINDSIHIQVHTLSHEHICLMVLLDIANAKYQRYIR